MAAVLDMTETLDTRVARLESDVAHIHTVVSDIKIDLRQLRTEFSVLRNTTETGFKAASAELHQELKAVRAEIAGSNARSAEEFKAVRAEIANSNARTAEEFKAVRAEMQVGFAAGRTDLADLRREIHRRDWAFVSIAITLFVALLGVMAQGFGWLH